MKLTENTKVRVKVPKHLYEAIQAELDKKHGMEEAEEMNEYVGMSPDQAQVAEILGSLIAAGGLGVAVKTALQMALDKIKSKKSGGEEKGDINEYVGMSPDQAQVAEILGSLIAAGGLGVAVKTALQMALDKIKSKKSSEAPKEMTEADREGVYSDFAKWKESFPEGTEFAQENNYMMAKDEDGKELGKWNPIQKQGMHASDFQYKSLEETFDLETLMEAVKDLSKKKAEDKKKKEVEAKKKKDAEDKKKKEAEAKKKAAAAKKK
jgi:hypothetical protein